MRENFDQESFIHDREYFVKKNDRDELVSVKKPIDFDEFPNAIKLDKNNKLDDEEVVKVLPDGTKVYRPDDPGEMYKPKEVNERNSLLEQTPERFRKEIEKGTLVQRTDYQGRFRKGFIQNEDSVAIRTLNEKKKPIVKNNLTEYVALTEIKYGYRPKGSDNFISYIVRPGENFWSPRSGEKKKESK